MSQENRRSCDSSSRRPRSGDVHAVEAFSRGLGTRASSTRGCRPRPDPRRIAAMTASAAGSPTWPTSGGNGNEIEEPRGGEVRTRWPTRNPLHRRRKETAVVRSRPELRLGVRGCPKGKILTRAATYAKRRGRPRSRGAVGVGDVAGELRQRGRPYAPGGPTARSSASRRLPREWTLVYLDFRSDEGKAGATPTGTSSVVDRSRADQEGGLVAIPSSAGSAAAADLPVAVTRCAGATNGWRLTHEQR